MAVVTQTEFITGWLRTLYTINTEPARNRSSEPYAILSHSGNFDVDAIALGNDAVLEVVLNLPEGSAYILKSMRLMMQEGVSNDTVTTWRDPFLRMFYARRLEEALKATSVPMDYPLASFFRETLGASTEDRWLLGGFGGVLSHDAAPVDAGASVPGPDYPTYGLSVNNVLNPTVIMQNRTADIGGWNLSFVIEWFAFNTEQAEHSSMYWPVPTRP